MKKHLKNIVIWATVVSVLLGTIIASRATALTTFEAINLMREAAKAQQITVVFYRCVNHGVEERSDKRVDPKDPFEHFTWFNVATGAWIEKRITNNVKDGQITCANKNGGLGILELFADTMGIDDPTRIICNGDEPGILKAQKKDDKWVDIKDENGSNACTKTLNRVNSGESGYRFVFNKGGSKSHVQSLYDEKIKGNEYAKKGEVGNETDAGLSSFVDPILNYFLYMDEFTAAECGHGKYSTDTEGERSKDTYPDEVPWLNLQTGEMETRYYELDYKRGWEASWLGKGIGATSCRASSFKELGGVMKRLTDLAPDVINALKDTEKDPPGATPPGTPPGDNNGDDGGSSLCSTAAASLGWIICPVIQAVGSATDWMYDYIENNYLQADANFVATKVTDEDGKESDSGAYKGWKTFQQIANILFAIALIIIILSQITGFGVSNYGVKKMLPSLIMVAILVNISFFLCQIAVDLSNIVGYSIKNTLAGLGSKNGAFGDGSIGSILGSPNEGGGILSIISGVGAIAGGGALIANIGSWIWPFLLMLLGVAISIIFFFILLGVRQAGIVLLVVLSPVAIVCYALPNAKNLFSRWWKMFFGLLIVYPICGALMGGGQFASKLLLSSTKTQENADFFFVMVAMLVQAVPFFFVPSIVKSSFAAMGNLGARISQFGRGLSGFTTDKIRKSDRFKSAQTRGRATSAKWAYGRNRLREKMRTNGGKIGKIASFIPGMGGISAAYRNSNLIGSGMARNAYNRRRAGQIGLIAAQQAANRRAQMTAENGLARAEENENNALREDYAKSYERDLSFVNDPKEQRKELDKMLDAIEQNPADHVKMAQLRGLQDFLSNSDKGQQIMQHTYNSRMKTAQDTTGKVSRGMQAAAANLANDHSELKGANRGFYEMLNDMASSDDEKVFEKGRFENKSYVDADNNTVSEVGNSHYDSKGAMKYDPRSIANASESALQRLASGVNAMTPEEAAAVYRSATAALTNDNIDVKPENEKYLNDIRRAAYAAMRTDFINSYVNHGEYVDNKGRTYTYIGNDTYGNAQYQREGTSKTYTYDGVNFMNNETTKIISGSRLSQDARDIFKAKYGAYQDLHSDMKINH